VPWQFYSVNKVAQSSFNYT